MPRPTSPRRYSFSKSPPTYVGGFAVIIIGIVAWVFLPDYSPQSWDLIWTVYTTFLWGVVWLACFGYCVGPLSRRWSSESVRQFRAHWLLCLVLAVAVFEMEVWSDGRILETLLWPVEKLFFWHYPLYWQPSCWSNRSLVCNVIFKPLRSAGIQWGALLAIYFYIWPQVQKLTSRRMWFLISWTAFWIILERLTDLRPLPWSSELKEVLEYDGFGAQFSIVRIGMALFDFLKAWSSSIFIAAFVSFYITEFAASIYGDPRRNPHINWDGYESSASAICHRFRENLRFRNYRTRRRYSLHKGTPNRDVSGHLSDGPPGRDFYPGSQNPEAHSMPSSRRVKTSFQGYEYTSESEATIPSRRGIHISSRGYPRIPSRMDESFYDKGCSSEETTYEYTTEEEDLTETSLSYSQPVVLNISSHNNTSQPRRVQQSATTIHPTPPARNTPQQQEAQKIRNEFCKSIGSAAVNGQPKISPQRFGMASDTEISTDEDTEEEDNRTERADSPEPIYVGHRINSRSVSHILSPKQPSQATASKKSTNNAVPPSPPISRLSYSRSLSPRESTSEPPSQRISPEPTTSTGSARGYIQSAKQSVPFSVSTQLPPQTQPTSTISDRTIMPPPPPPPPRGRMPSTASRGSRTPSTHSRIPRSASRSKTASVTETPVKKPVATPKLQATPRTPRNAVRASSPPASRTRSAMRRRLLDGV